MKVELYVSVEGSNYKKGFRKTFKKPIIWFTKIWNTLLLRKKLKECGLVDYSVDTWILGSFLQTTSNNNKAVYKILTDTSIRLTILEHGNFEDIKERISKYVPEIKKTFNTECVLVIYTPCTYEYRS